MTMIYLRQRLEAFLPLWWSGEDYYLLSRFQVRMSWWIAGVIADTRAEIREERECRKRAQG